MRSGAKTVDAYLAALPTDRSAALGAVRDRILARLPDGYVEAMNWGMIAYEVPLAVCPETYNGQPLMYAALASQKNHMAVYLCAIDCGIASREALARAYAAKGRKLDMGAACLRFKRLDDIDLDAIGDVIGSTPMADFIAAAQRPAKAARATRKAATGARGK